MRTKLQKNFNCAALLLTLSLSVATSTTDTDTASSSSAIPLFVDTDLGVDDAVAIAWLLNNRSATILGFSTVAGNTTVENATANLLTLLASADRLDLPVTLGSATPLEFPATRIGAFVHGPDGLWFNQQSHDLTQIPTDAPAAIAAAARAQPDLTLIALGPLTNVARAVQQFPSDLAHKRLVALVGAQKMGNTTPVAEFNSYVDPHALDIVLGSDLDVTLITREAFVQLQVDAVLFPRRLSQRGDRLGQLLAASLTPYLQFQTDRDERPQRDAARQRRRSVAIPDAAAVIYALHPELGRSTSALVKVMTAASLSRGQTIIGTELSARIPMIATDAELSALAEQAFLPDFDFNTALMAILQRQPDNAHVVLNVDGRAMSRILERGLMRST